MYENDDDALPAQDRLLHDDICGREDPGDRGLTEDAVEVAGARLVAPLGAVRAQGAVRARCGIGTGLSPGARLRVGGGRGAGESGKPSLDQI